MHPKWQQHCSRLGGGIASPRTRWGPPPPSKSVVALPTPHTFQCTCFLRCRMPPSTSTPGTYSECVAADEQTVCLTPPGVSFLAAAAAPMPGQTASITGPGFRPQANQSVATPTPTYTPTPPYTHVHYFMHTLPPMATASFKPRDLRRIRIGRRADSVPDAPGCQLPGSCRSAHGGPDGLAGPGNGDATPREARADPCRGWWSGKLRDSGGGRLGCLTPVDRRKPQSVWTATLATPGPVMISWTSSSSSSLLCAIVSHHRHVLSRALMQIAKAHGAHVTTTCSTRNIEFVTEVLGADEAIDYTGVSNHCRHSGLEVMLHSCLLSRTSSHQLVLGI